MEQYEHHSERFKLLYMLDRGQKVPPSKAVCSCCADTHDRSLFPSESLAQSSQDRRCLGSAGPIWVCSHWTFDHSLVTDYLWKTLAKPHMRKQGGLGEAIRLANNGTNYRLADSNASWWYCGTIDRARGEHASSDKLDYMQAFTIFRRIRVALLLSEL